MDIHVRGKPSNSIINQSFFFLFLFFFFFFFWGGGGGGGGGGGVKTDSGGCCNIGYPSEKHLNTLRPRQKGRHFPDDSFRCIFVNGNVWISIKISLNFVSKGPIKGPRIGSDNGLAPMMVSLLTHICVAWVKLKSRLHTMCCSVVNSFWTFA